MAAISTSVSVATTGETTLGTAGRSALICSAARVVMDDGVPGYMIASQESSKKLRPLNVCLWNETSLPGVWAMALSPISFRL